MQISCSPYFRFVSLWKKWLPIIALANLSEQKGAKEKSAKKKVPNAYGGIQSPESFRLRGPRSADPQRKNPAP
ncbi:hypothetical protein [Paracnuella aquatica]|uniref:hypothetical protein n=1 Tax=Paracnuella aquatica TaxID=2268757 RepID=UPI000F4DA7EF|nr:hypothetical protein [Paracnuella aquatica]RPD48923.1 hypothetical protein DRJ53_09695 [Paracnuella aquatica]